MREYDELRMIVGIPAFNEEKNIVSIIVKLKKITDHIVVCNDGSSDLTKEIAEKLGAIVVNHSKNLGYGAAIKTIFQKAKELETDVLVTFDADGQHRVEDIESILEPIKQNQADIVIGSRFLNKHESDVPSYRKLGIKVITKVTNVSIKENLTDSQSGFRAYSKNVIKDLVLSDIGMGISTEILIKAGNKNFRICEVPITVLYSDNSPTHNPIEHGMSVLISTIKYTSIEHPLKFYGIPSLVFLIMGLVFTYLSIQYYTEVGRLNTNLTVISAATVLIGIVLIITSVLLYSLVSVVREKTP